MLKSRIFSILILVFAVWAGWYVYQSELSQTNPFRLGLDLSGGSYLVYRADTSSVQEDVNTSMDALRDVIERRINAFGVAEPNVRTETQNIGVEGTEHRLTVELPGVTDIDQAIELIGQTPLLEFKVEAGQEEIDRINQAVAELLVTDQEGAEDASDVELTLEQGEALLGQLEELNNQRYVDTQLTGAFLRRSQLQFSQAGVAQGGTLQNTPIVAITFNQEGADLFEQITRENIGKTIAIYLDGELVSAPVVNTVISGGQAIIEGNFSLDEARTLVGRLNSGALPIPIELISTNTIGPSLGQEAVEAGMYAGLIGLAIVILILLLWYRLPGLIAVIALGVYTAFMLWLFKFIPVTLTASGIAGFIISIGIAVDANILIFERIKEERRNGVPTPDAVSTGFKRAWASIRDANISSIISAAILFGTSIALIQGFALTFGLGILISMFTAVTFTRFMLLALQTKRKKDHKESKLHNFLYGSGFSN